VLSYLVLLAPASLLLVWLLSTSASGPRPRSVLVAATVATGLSLAIAIAAAIAVATQGAATGALIGAAGLGLSVRLDAISSTMFLLVAFVGVIVVRFSRNYLDGDDRQGYFTGGLSLTLASVMLLVLAGNVSHLVFAWIATSLSLHRLLLFYRDRPVAIIAARKKFITARIGDACLIAAAFLLTSAFGTTDIATMLDAARGLGADTATLARPDGVFVATLLIACAALLKSAQFPTHGWLPEVMETPTPVSALLHAGIINAGGFLVIRFADVMLLSMPSLHVLAIVGGFTALFGGIVMLTQTSVKVSLAWSTVSQMGFMLLQCGLGAFSLAMLHIVAHSLYKAHAFLSSGSVIDIARSAWVPNLEVRPRAARLAASLVLALALYGGIGVLFGLVTAESAAVLTLGAIMIMGLTLLIKQSMRGGARVAVVARVVAAAGGATVAYFLLHLGTEALFASTLPPIPTPDVIDLAVMALALVSFGAVTLLQVLAPVWVSQRAWQTARVHLANGFYVNALFNRLVGALDRRTATHA
jgi:NAD(P)H-quinone oxidoreductase subunit 5